MTAATQGRNTVQLEGGKPLPGSIVVPVAASTKIYQGTLVALNSSGYAVPASAALNLRIIGMAEGPGDQGIVGDVDNSSGAAGALTCRVKSGVFPFTANTTIAKTDLLKPVYAVDDSTVDLSDGGGLRPFAGYVVGTDSLLGTTSLGAFVLTGALVAALGLVDPTPGPGSGATFQARAVATAALAAYTVAAATGVITANANGALGSVFDGVTIVAGDTVFLPEGIAAAAADAGPYVVTSLGGAGKFVLTRPDWWAHGSIINRYQPIAIAEGTVWTGSEWKSFVTTDAKVVGTDAPLDFPRRFVKSVALVAGTTTVTTCPIRSATLTKVSINRTVANTSTLTVGGYHPTTGGATGMTAGALGTGQVIIEACVGAGTINNADISTITIEITNW